MIYEGTIGVHATQVEDMPVYDVFFAPNVDGGECHSRRFRVLDELAEFLKCLNVRKEVIARALEEVRAGRSPSIAHIVLSDDVISDEGLDSKVTLNRRIN